MGCQYCSKHMNFCGAHVPDFELKRFWSCTRPPGHSGFHIACRPIFDEHDITDVLIQLTFKFEQHGLPIL